MNDEEKIVIDGSDMQAIYEESQRVQGELCLMSHPIFHVLCLRNIGHPGKHWFMVRWDGSREAIAHARDVIKGLPR